MPQFHQVYHQLRRHLDAQPVGYPRTRSGIEIKILQFIFSQPQAHIALAMNYLFQNSGSIHQRVAQNSADPAPTLDQIEKELGNMVQRGAILLKKASGSRSYALAPLAIGMYELQLNRLTTEFVRDLKHYFRKKFALSYLMTPRQQMRIIPVEKSIMAHNRVESYDNMEELIKGAGDSLALAPCTCRKSQVLEDHHCDRTRRMDVCVVMRDMAEQIIETGIGRRISTQEALDSLRQSQREGLVLQTSGEQEPQVLCACCACCCGVLAMYQFLGNPSKFVDTNHYVAVNAELCHGCGLCSKKCPMTALHLQQKTGKIALSIQRCIGCGVCVASCKKGALTLCDKEHKSVPPFTTEDLYEYLVSHKKGPLAKIWAFLQIAWGIICYPKPTAGPQKALINEMSQS